VYEPSGNERIVPIEPPLPTADAGTPEPSVGANEGGAAIAYWTPPRDGSRRVAVVQFAAGRIYFGPPNDEAFNGHPLYEAGLKPYEFAEVLNSPWIAAMERMNRVHPYHDPARFAALHHFVLPFHDSTFECVAATVRASVTEATDPPSAIESTLHDL
jgi:hypothetical protein